ncbi:hypothetical protein [Olivibacter sitiensis]|uniref:hypothetical protein n=1 Tax=Olivibacter sitiensis TaxID=376470 RepID=UPI000425CAC3|nr:hypothetical protein [Olivibacter sitiensis]
MTTHLKSCITLIALFVLLSAQPQLWAQKGGSILPTVQKHKQIYAMSCIPSSVEMVLKFNRKVGTGFYDFQQQWKNKTDGSFANFDGKTIHGLTFTHRFKDRRSPDFPINRLFATIDKELSEGRKVIVSLVSGPSMWHIYVIDRQTAQGDYVCYSRAYEDDQVLELTNTKEIIRQMRGTDILTYTSN